MAMRVLCNAVIDGNVVTVVGVGQHSGITREYVIEGEDETTMAMEGIRRFVEEHQNGDAE
jgi:hypothetical protein